MSTPTDSSLPHGFARWTRWLLALTLGFGGAIALAFIIHWYDVTVFRQTVTPSQLAGNALSLFALFFFFLLIALINPLLRRSIPSLGLERRHLLSVLGLWILAGLMAGQILTPALHAAGTARNAARATPEMRRNQVLDLLEDPRFLTPENASAYYYGLGDGMERVALSKIPWRAWARPLAFTLPLVAALVIMASSLVRVVHRQWSRHELLTYPLADFLRGLMEVDRGRAFPPLLRDRLFWTGFLLIAVVLFINGLHLWFQEMIVIPLAFSQIQLLNQFPFLSKYCGTEGYSLLRGFAFPFMVSIAVLLPTEVSLTGWAGWILFVLGTGGWFLATGEPLRTVPMQQGMYLAMGVMILYIGRREYAAILRNAVRLAPADDPALRGAVSSARLFALAAAVAAWHLARAGLGWPLALIVVACLSLGFLLAARITAETGIPFLPGFLFGFLAIPIKFFGAAAFGPRGLVALATLPLLATSGDHSNSVAAQETSRRKIEEAETDGFSRRLDRLLAIGLLLTLAAGTLFILWDNYSFGARQENQAGAALYKGNANLQIYGLSTVGPELGRLKAEGIGDAKGAWDHLARLIHPTPEKDYGRFFLLGATLVAGCAFLRGRFAGWPFHPLPLLLLGTWILSRLYFAFFLGWLIKVALLRIAGGRAFARSKPFFFGVIAGSVVMGGAWLVTAMIYHLVTGIKPPVVNFFI